MSESSCARSITWWRSPGVLVTIAAALVVVMVAVESVVALAISLMECLVVWVVLAGAGLAGGWVMRWLGLRDAPWSARLVFGAGLGLGLLPLIVLGLGTAGVLTKVTVWLLAAVLVVAGCVRLILDLRSHRQAAPLAGWHWLWLCVCPFIALIVVANCLPPGILWIEEGNGYDVLEYHLAVPKTFLEQGDITFLPNNVYSNFPLGYEMLALLMMTLRGDGIGAAFMAQSVNSGLAVLFIAAAWYCGREFSPLSGVVAGVLAGTAPWIAYLAGIAFVEVGMLGMGMCALAALVQARKDRDRAVRWICLAGVLAGFACGFKYTAVPLIAFPFVLLIALGREPIRRRFVYIAGYAICAFIAFSPWSIRNVINTGNPVFPLAHSVFGADPAAWDDELAQRWYDGHQVSDSERSGENPIVLGLRRTVAEPRMGYLVFLLAAMAAVWRRDRLTFALVLTGLVQWAIWLNATHQYARFAVVILLPLIPLAARIAEHPLRRVVLKSLCAAMVIGAGWNLYHIAGLYYHHTRIDGEPVHAYGRIDAFMEQDWLGAVNRLGSRARVILVGEARSYYIRPPCEYATVFNRHPLSEALRQGYSAKGVLEWLRRHGTTHVLVHFGEMRRLRRTYGFDENITPELFVSLTEAGLIEKDNFALYPGQPPYAVLYEVPQHE